MFAGLMALFFLVSIALEIIVPFLLIYWLCSCIKDWLLSFRFVRIVVTTVQCILGSIVLFFCVAGIFISIHDYFFAIH